MKRIINIIICILILCTVCGCGGVEDNLTSGISVAEGKKTRTVTLENYDVSFSIPDDCAVDMTDTELDLFCRNDDFIMSVFCYLTVDLAEGDTAEKMWQRQIESDLERFKNVKSLEHKPDFKSKDKTLSTELHSFENDGTKYYSYYVFAESKENLDKFLWISFVGIPSKIRDNFDALEQIVDSIAFK